MHPFGNSIVKLWATGAQLKRPGRRAYARGGVRGPTSTVSWPVILTAAGTSPTWQAGKRGGSTLKRGLRGLKYRFKKGGGLEQLAWANGTEVRDTDRASLAITDYAFGRSKVFRHNELFHMGTVNDAVPLVLALYAAVEHRGCIHPRLQGRIVRSGT